MQYRILALIFYFLFVIQIQAEGNEPQFRQPVNCAKQRDGNYVWGCSRFYSICTNGRELPMQCYMGLKLNPDNNQCDSPAEIDVCQDPNSSSQLYRSKDPFNCAEQPDGLYEANPCSPGYIQCTQGRRFDQTCPNGLVFNSHAGVCDYASKCKKAKTKKRVVKKIAYASQQPILQDPFSNQNSPPAPQSPHPYNQQQQYQPSQSNPQVQQNDLPQQTSSSSFDCTGRGDGVYLRNASGCNSGFFKCANGQAFTYNCSAGLAYNPQNGQCDYPQYVTACGGTPIDPPTTTTPAPQINAPQFDCTARADGLYSNGNCNSPFFYSCLGGTSTALKCSPGLVFDTLNNICDYPEECGKPKTTVPPQEQDPVKPNLEHGTSGYYFNSGSKQYFNVAYAQSYSNFNNAGNNQQNSQQVPSGQQQMVPVVQVGEEGQEQQPSQPSSSSQAPSSPGGSLSISCAGKQNGYYVRQSCTPNFFSCSNGIPTQAICPGGLVFDAEKAQCEFASECGRQTSPSTNSSPNQQPEQPQIPPSNTNNVVGVGQPQTSSSSSFNCGGRRNGYYVQRQCTPDFYICSNGFPTKVTCPGGLVFDIENAQCEFANTCGQTGTPPTPNMSQSPNQQIPPSSVQIPPPPQTLESTNGEGGPQPPSTQQQQQIPQIDCGGRPNGYYYRQPCQSTFVICASGIAVVQSCPQGTVFEPKSARCQHETECTKNSNNVAIPTPSINSQQPQGPMESNSPQSQQPIRIIDVPVQSVAEANQVSGGGFNCFGKPNGHYFSQSCQPNWIICSGGQTINQTCPNGLVFDPSGAQCEFPTNCGKSGNGNVVESPTPSSSSSSSNNNNGVSQPRSPSPSSQCGQCPQPSPVNQQPMQPVQQPAQPVVPLVPQISQPSSSSSSSFNCAGKQDGTYLRTQCQPTYVVCSGGVTVQQSCPPGLVFDSDTAQCEFPAECGKNSQQQQTQQSNSGQSPQIQPQPVESPTPQVASPANPPRLPTSAGGFQCARRIDGYYYRKACTPHFYTCVGGHATQLTCPGNLVFDPSNALCQYADVCGRPRPPPTGQEETENSNPQPPPPQTDFNCQGRRNGYYVKKGCTPHFYTCLGGVATKLTCPGNLVFDNQSASCQYPTICANQQLQQMPNVASSTSSNISPSNPAPSSQSQPTPTQIQPQQIPTNVMPPLAPNFDCTGRTNGAYAIGECENAYIQCSNGYAHQQQCPGELVFSIAANNSCDFIDSCRRPPSSNTPNNNSPQQQPNQQAVNVGTVPNSPIFNVPNTPTATIQQQQPPPSPSGGQQVPVNQQPANVAPVNQQIPASNFGSANQPQPNIPTAANQSAPVQTNVQGQQLPPRPRNQPSPVVQPTSAAFCSIGNKSEGMHAQGCNNHFYACSGGVTTQMNCPVGLYFDDETEQCDMRDTIVACGGQKKSDTTVWSRNWATTKFSANKH